MINNINKYDKNEKGLRGVIKKFVDCIYKNKTPKDTSMKIEHFLNIIFLGYITS